LSTPRRSRGVTRRVSTMSNRKAAVRLCGLTLCTLIVALASPMSAWAEHEGSQHYSRSTLSCIVGDTSNLVDPVTVVFLGFVPGSQGGHSNRTDALLEAMSDPDHDWQNGSGRTQYMGSGETCTDMENQVWTPYFNPIDDGFPRRVRYHIRLNHNQSADLNGRYRTVGTPHYEVDTEACGDAVPPHVPPGVAENPSGYDYARGHVKNDWIADRGGSVFDVQGWRNTRLMRQCNGWLSNSTGRVYFLNTD
jgi:hypothetical protein